MSRTLLKGEDFIKKLFEGERDFSGIELETGFSLSKNYITQQWYRFMFDQNFEESPLDLSNSRFSFVSFRYFGPIGLNFSYSNCENTLFVESDLRHINFRNADLNGASFWNADLSYVDFRFANLSDANFWDARLCDTDFRGVKNLEKARNIETAYFHSPVRVTPMERSIFEEILSKKRLFSDYLNCEEIKLF